MCKCDCQRSEKEGGPELDCLWNWSVNICILMIFLFFYFFFLHLLCYSHPRVWKRTVHFIHLLFFVCFQLTDLSLFNDTTHAKGKDPSSPTIIEEEIKLACYRVCYMSFASGPASLKAHVASSLFCTSSIYKTLGKKVFYSLYLRLMERDFNHIFKNQSDGQLKHFQSLKKPQKPNVLLMDYNVIIFI